MTLESTDVCVMCMARMDGYIATKYYSERIADKLW